MEETVITNTDNDVINDNLENRKTSEASNENDVNINSDINIGNDIIHDSTETGLDIVTPCNDIPMETTVSNVIVINEDTTLDVTINEAQGYDTISELDKTSFLNDTVNIP